MRKKSAGCSRFMLVDLCRFARKGIRMHLHDQFSVSLSDLFRISICRETKDAECFFFCQSYLSFLIIMLTGLRRREAGLNLFYIQDINKSRNSKNFHNNLVYIDNYHLSRFVHLLLR